MSDGVMRAVFAVAVVGLIGCYAVTPAHADTVADVQKANSLLQRAEANLRSVDGSIGKRTSPPKGSAAKLAASRLDQAWRDIQPAGALLENVPDGTEGAADAKQRHADAVALHDKLRGILAGGDAPPPPDAGGVKLDHHQEKALKDARYYQRELQAAADRLTQLHAELLPIEDQKTINHKVVFAAMEDVAFAKQRAGLIKERLDTLPVDGQGVSTVVAQYNAAVEAVAGAEAFLTPLHAKMRELTDPANYPEFDADFKHIGELGLMYSRPETLEQNRRAAAEAVRQSNPAYQEMARIVAKYEPIINQQTDQGERMAKQMSWFLEKYNAYGARSREVSAALPEQIRADLGEAQQYADEAVAEQKPAFFQGGIPQRYDWAEEKLYLLEALDAESAAAMKQEMQAIKERIAKQETSLAEAIIASNPLPPDRFADEDRDAAIAIAVDGWKHQQPEFELLGVRVPSQAWERSTRWEWSAGAWHLYDKSTLQVQLLVADENNPALAIIRPVNVRKDHNKGDTMIGIPLWSIDDDVPPRSYLMRDKIK